MLGSTRKPPLVFISFKFVHGFRARTKNITVLYYYYFCIVLGKAKFLFKRPVKKFSPLQLSCSLLCMLAATAKILPSLLFV